MGWEMALREIVNQVKRIFGIQAHYLIDFYHLCDYLAAASVHCAPTNYLSWLQRQKQRLKHNQVSAVLTSLKPYLEPENLPDERAPVRACHRYLINRPGQFNYQDAINDELPIGSGEIESAHGYVIQERLKLSGCWWKLENAMTMLALRVLRANGDWNSYWQKIQMAIGASHCAKRNRLMPSLLITPTLQDKKTVKRKYPTDKH